MKKRETKRTLHSVLFSTAVFASVFAWTTEVQAEEQAAPEDLNHKVNEEKLSENLSAIEGEDESLEESTEEVEETETKPEEGPLAQSEKEALQIVKEPVNEEDFKAVQETEESVSEENLVPEPSLQENPHKESRVEGLETETSETLDEPTKDVVAYSASNVKENTVTRVSGPNRYSNAAVIAKEGWKESQRVFLASGEIFTDMLTGSPLAGLDDSPILLTRPERLPDETFQAIRDLNAKEVIILGGPPSVSTDIYNRLTREGLEVSRIAGRDRYEQAAKVANEIITYYDEVKEPGKKRPAFLTTGEDFPDGLNIASIAAEKHIPIYLTRGDRLNEHVIEAVPRVSSFIIVGGENRVSQNVEDQLRALGVDVRRFDGRNRYDLNRNIISYYGAGEKTNHAYVVNGEIFSDGLPASVLAAKNNSALLIVKNNDGTIKEQLDFASEKGINRFTFIGGEPTLSRATFEAFQKYVPVQPTKKNPVVSIASPDVSKAPVPTKSNPTKSYPVIRDVIYSPKRGESLADIARRFGSSVDAIIARNGLKDATIYHGQTLRIPQSQARPMDIPASKDGRNIIFIDPGHGGSDPGAVAYGDRESDMNMVMANQLKDELNKRGYEVIMARTTDRDVSLLDRSRMANNSNADIFLSLHHNAMGRPETASGIETFYYEYHTSYPASINPMDNNAQRLTNSKYLADLIQNNMIKNTGAVNRGVKTNTFSVLRETQIPAVLLEYGFLDNKRENDLLGTASYQRKLTTAVADAVDTFFKTVY